MFRWLAPNLRTFLLAFALALVIWVTAVTAANPDETQVYPNPISIEFIGQDPGLIMTGGTVPQQVEITLRAPHSVWQSLLSGESSARAVVDLTGLGSGTHTVNVQMQIDARPVRILSVTPQTFDLSLEPQVTRSLKINLTLTGNPAIGYQVGYAVLDPAEVVITGAESLVSQIDHIQATLDLTDARQNIAASIPLQVVDVNGTVIRGVTVLPDNVQVSLPIIQQGGYRDLAVKVMTVGNPASGYSLTSVAAFPPIVTVYSANSDTIDSMPGYVETSSLVLSGAKEDIEKQLGIILPPGVTLIGEQSVLVKVGIAPIESSLLFLYRPVEMIGLATGLDADLSPQTVDVILSGPLPVLESLAISDIHVQVDLTGLAPGTYQLTPKVSIAQQNMTVESILPGTVEVIITNTITPTP
ncbi:MAG: CdaR family protein [Anaerolineales bacterium]|nr:CdaR family protein [Anaerolineales bacterium]